jgi:23S rRNA (pseudouridine1915-N3)-methyltransferase
VLTVSILAGGRGKASPETAIAQVYLDKARDHGRALGFAGFALAEASEKNLSAALQRLAHPVFLDETGKSHSSQAFAAWLAKLRDQGQSGLTFVVGGADGFSQADRAHAKSFLAFGPQTWPHLLVRTMLAEQLFRAMTILGGHPYHRDGAR